MRESLRRALTLGLLLVLGLAMLASSARAMPSAEEEQYLQLRHAVEDLVARVNQIASQCIVIAETTNSHEVFDSVIQRVNAFMSAFIEEMQPTLCRLSLLSGERHQLVCTYVRVYNRYLDRIALVDPIHLTSSGD